MKFPASFDLQNNNWNGIFHHVDRTFLDKITGTRQDANLDHINPELSKYNYSTDGTLKNGRFIYNNKLNNRRLQSLQDRINNIYSDYIKNHNNSKSVQRHPDRKIKNYFKEKLLDKPATKNDKKKNKSNKNKLDVFQKTVVQSVGNSDINNKLIKIIMQKKHENYIKARNQFLRASSLALFISAKTINKRYKNIYLLSTSTNVDEFSHKIKGRFTGVDAVHSHSALLGVSWTKLDKNFKPVKPSSYLDKRGKVHHTRGAKPSFSFARAICQSEKVPYSQKKVRIKANNKNGYRYVNGSLHQALSKFRIQEGIHQTKVFNEILKDKLHINFHLRYSQTHQRRNGRSMSAEREYLKYKNLIKKEKLNHQKLVKYRANQRRKNSKARLRTYYNQYHKHYRAMIKLNNKASNAKRIINSAQSLSSSYSQSASNVISSALGTNQSEANTNSLDYHLPKLTPSLMARKERAYKINHQKDIKRANAQLEKITGIENTKTKKIEEQDKQIHINQLKIEYQQSTIHKLSSKFTSIINKYRKSFTNIAKDTIKSTTKALKQTRQQELSKEQAPINSYADNTINRAVDKLRAKASQMPNTFFGKIKKNFYNYKADRKSSSELQSLNNSVAAPVQAKRDSWISLRNHLNLHANDLYQESYEQLIKMNKEVAPPTSEQFSQAVKSATGLNLVQYSNSVSFSQIASKSRAKPIKQAKYASFAKSFNSSYDNKMKLVHSKTRQLKQIHKQQQKQNASYNFWRNKIFSEKMKNPKFRKKFNHLKNGRNQEPIR